MRNFQLMIPVLAGLLLIDSQAGAHMLNMYDCDRVFEVRLSESFVDVRLLYSFREFPSLAERLEMDRDADDLISEREAADYARQWLERMLKGIELEAAGRKLELQPLRDPLLDLYGSQRIIPRHHDLTIELSAKTSLAVVDPVRWSFRLNEPEQWPHPGKEILALIAGRDIAVDSTSLDDQTVTARPRPYENFSFFCRRRSEPEIGAAESSGESQWRIVKFIQSYHMPQLAANTGKAAANPPSGGVLEPVSLSGGVNNAETEAQDEKLRALVLGYLEGREGGVAALWILLAAAFIYGCIHALAPGHAKTLTAAYLVGSSYRWPQALFLAGVVTLTHTGSILILAIATRLAWGEGLSAHTQSLLTGISGVIVLVLGIQRLRAGAGQPHFHVHSEGQAHVHGGEEEGHVHAEDNPRGPGHAEQNEREHPDGYSQIAWLGLAGGLAPCPGAIWIYFLALGFGRPGLAIALIISLSLGLALVLIAVGLATIYFRRALDRQTGLEETAAKAKRKQILEIVSQRLLGVLPTAAGTALILIGSFLVFKSLSSLGWI